jgi:hypothetical protein
MQQVDPAVSDVFHGDDQIVFAAGTKVNDASADALLKVLGDYRHDPLFHCDLLFKRLLRQAQQPRKRGPGQRWSAPPDERP